MGQSEQQNLARVSKNRDTFTARTKLVTNLFLDEVAERTSFWVHPL